ncbi:Hypothetical predicted protein [Paramuricea clavata]|uniref:Uncharacterized protein n=1 Tax=Paramuricea clavata TaxID=317549 RepID=A0A6S7G750_PARCT|nr:Hypothetical predicted protein [Paramuricea clavata]
MVYPYMTIWLFQKHCNCASAKLFCCHTGWKITLEGSCFTHAAASRSAPMEGEALAIAGALDKARFFVLGGGKLIVAVYHKCLEYSSNVRLRKTLRYRFQMVHIPGIKHKAADAMSRHPTGPHNPEALPIPDDITAMNESCNTILPPFIPFGHLFLAGIRSKTPHSIITPRP